MTRVNQRIKNPGQFHPDVPEALMPEMELQEYVIGHLQARDYIVLQTGIARSKVKCSVCGQWSYPSGWQGNDPGLPDLLITRPEWGNHWIVVETKTLRGLKLNGEPRAGDIKPEQQRLVDLGVSDIARTLRQVMDIIDANKPIMKPAGSPAAQCFSPEFLNNLFS